VGESWGGTMQRRLTIVLFVALVFCVGGYTTYSKEVNIQELIDLAKKGGEKDQYNLANIYYNGEGYKTAFYWYGKAADQGYEPAQTRLAYLYLLGIGTEQNEKQGIYRFEKLAEQGNAYAQRIMGLYHFGNWHGEVDIGDGIVSTTSGYRDGRSYKTTTSVPQEDPVEAVRWFQLAANQNDGWAMHSLGVCYSEGRGISEDMPRAIAWFSLSGIALDKDYSYEISAQKMAQFKTKYGSGLGDAEVEEFIVARKLAREYAEKITGENVSTNLAAKIDGKIDQFEQARSKYLREQQEREYKEREAELKKARWGWINSVFGAIGDLFSGLLEIGFVGFALGIVILIFIGGLVYWIFLILREVTLGVSGFIRALFHGIVQLIEIPYQLLFDAPAKNKKIKELEAEVCYLRDEVANSLKKSQVRALSMPDETYDPMDDEYIDDSRTPSPFDPDDWGHGAINPSHDPSENPWIDEFGEGDEADVAYWNTD